MRPVPSIGAALALAVLTACTTQVDPDTPPTTDSGGGSSATEEATGASSRAASACPVDAGRRAG